MIQWLGWLIEHKLVFIPIAAIISIVMIGGLFKFIDGLGVIRNWLYQKGFLTYKSSRQFWVAFPTIFLAVVVLGTVFYWGYERGLGASPHDRAMHTLYELFPDPEY